MLLALAYNLFDQSIINNHFTVLLVGVMLVYAVCGYFVSFLVVIVAIADIAYTFWAQDQRVIARPKQKKQKQKHEPSRLSQPLYPMTLQPQSMPHAPQAQQAQQAPNVSFQPMPPQGLDTIIESSHESESTSSHHSIEIETATNEDSNSSLIMLWRGHDCP